MSLSSGDNLPNAVVEPPAALANASVTVANGLPVAALISIARAANSWAFATSCVWVTNRDKAGRKSSSVTPSNLPCVLIQSSLAFICASVAPVFFVIVAANSCCAASSSIAPFVASPKATAKPDNARPAGTAAFLIANWAFFPAPSSC